MTFDVWRGDEAGPYALIGSYQVREGDHFAIDRCVDTVLIGKMT
jgi:hypothetical protein